MADVTRLLDEAGIDFDILEHPHTESATAEATALGVAAEEVAKTLVLVASSGNVRAVLAASERIDVHKVAATLEVGRKKVHLASEDNLAHDYPEFELGVCHPSAAAKIGCSWTTGSPGATRSWSRPAPTTDRCA